MPALQVLIKRRKRGRTGVETWEVVRARGHLDEVQELKATEPTVGPDGKASKESMQLVLTEGAVLGGGAFSRVSIVTGGRPLGAAMHGAHARDCAVQNRAATGLGSALHGAPAWDCAGQKSAASIVTGRQRLAAALQGAAQYQIMHRVVLGRVQLVWGMVTGVDLLLETVCAEAHPNQPKRPLTGPLPACRA